MMARACWVQVENLGKLFHILCIPRSRSDSKKRFILNESFVKRTILNLDNIVDKKLKKAKQNEFRYRVSESLQKKPPAYYQKKL